MLTMDIYLGIVFDGISFVFLGSMNGLNFFFRYLITWDLQQDSVIHLNLHFISCFPAQQFDFSYQILKLWFWVCC